MLIRVSGYNSGVKEYLEEGVKNGRDYSREELDERLILYGDLDLTDMVYKSIPDRGQNRYTTFTLAFKEDEISEEVLKNITKEFREFMMYAYNDVEYNFYAEAHIPKLKTVYDKRTGEKIERKPHIHIVVPKINLLSGNVSDVIGNHETTEKFIEAFQEYVNQKYCLASPREHVRVNPYNAADVLSRYKGDDFRGKNRSSSKALFVKLLILTCDQEKGSILSFRLVVIHALLMKEKITNTLKLSWKGMPNTQRLKKLFSMMRLLRKGNFPGPHWKKHNC